MIDLHRYMLAAAAPMLRSSAAAARPDAVALVVLPFVGAPIQVSFVSRKTAATKARLRGMIELASEIKHPRGATATTVLCVMLCGMPGIYNIPRAHFAAAPPAAEDGGGDEPGA